ncbi:MAG: hypothetical protein EOM40_17050 [Clostridia bacterium]|nr:hypothetical protein [Clostridia bacterium]NCC42693.1 hypothetical protein [Clostridia bacterium]
MDCKKPEKSIRITLEEKAFNCAAKPAYHCCAFCDRNFPGSVLISASGDFEFLIELNIIRVKEARKKGILTEESGNPYRMDTSYNISVNEREIYVPQKLMEGIGADTGSKTAVYRVKYVERNMTLDFYLVCNEYKEDKMESMLEHMAEIERFEKVGVHSIKNVGECAEVWKLVWGHGNAG